MCGVFNVIGFEVVVWVVVMECGDCGVWVGEDVLWVVGIWKGWGV